MPRPHPSEFRAEAIRLARSGERPIRETALGLGISESCLRRWLDQGDVEGGRTEGLTGGEQEEILRLRRENRVLRQEREILNTAAAFFIRESETLCWCFGLSRRKRPPIRSGRCAACCARL